jgi:hypothetical protein
MPNYILNERDEAVQEEDWEKYAVWFCDNRDCLVIASDDIRDSRNRYVTTVNTHFRGHVENVADMAADKPRVWLTETTDGSLSKAVATRKEAEENHRRFVKYLRNCYRSK